MGIIVQKFGGTSVANAEKIRGAARRAIRAQQNGNQVVMVVSAMGHQTDVLVDLAKQITDDPSGREMDMLLSTGEQVSVALMAMAIQSLGAEAVSLTGAQIGMLRDDGVKQAFLDLKKAGKIRFAGVSCHDAMLPEILETAAEVGWIDQIMIQYNFRVMPGGGRGRGAGGNAEEFAKAFGDKLQRAIDKAVKANLGLIAMKSQSGAASFPDRVAKWTEKGVKKEVAAIKAVWGDDRMQVVVSEMTTRSDLRENIAASREALTVKEAKLLEEHRNATSKLYCHGCGHLCETAARGVPVATVLRYYRYYEAYGKREQARALYQALPNVSRQLIDENLLAAEAACPFELPVAQLVKNAHSKLS